MVGLGASDPAARFFFGSEEGRASVACPAFGQPAAEQRLGFFLARLRRMGKKNSKLKAERLFKLVNETYCEFTF